MKEAPAKKASKENSMFLILQSSRKLKYGRADASTQTVAEECFHVGCISYFLQDSTVVHLFRSFFTLTVRIFDHNLAENSAGLFPGHI